MSVETESAQEQALALCQAYLQVMRLVRLYDVDNVNFDEPIAQLQELIGKIVARQGSVRLQAEEGMVYFNKEPLRSGKRGFNVIQALVKSFEDLGMAELAIVGAAGERELRELCAVLRESVNAGADAVRAIQEAIRERGLGDRFAVNAPGETSGKAIVRTVEIDERTYFPLAYARTLVLLREYVQNLRDEELNRYFTEKLHRALQEFVKLAPKHEQRFLALAALRSGEHLFVRMTATGLLSILLGQRLGLGKVQLTDLGLSAMLHGIGWFRSPEGLVEKASLAPEEKVELGKHPYRALAAFLEGRKVTAKMLVSAAVAFQFDLHTGRTPIRVQPEEVHPFCQIIRVCSDYVQLSSDLEDRPALLPDQALKKMIEARPGTYDTLVLTMFTNMMGLYPTGSVVSLSTGEVAVVVHPNPERPKKPLVAVVLDGDGRQIDGDFLDLAEPGVRSRITGSVDPSELGLHIPDYLLS